jgi:hypothetical protein
MPADRPAPGAAPGKRSVQAIPTSPRGTALCASGATVPISPSTAEAGARGIDGRFIDPPSDSAKLPLVRNADTTSRAAPRPSDQARSKGSRVPRPATRYCRPPFLPSVASR